MANEINITLSVTVQNGNYRETIGKTVAADQAAIGEASGVLNVGTTEEVMPTGDVGTFGWLYLENLDPTNYVRYGPTSGGAMVPLGRLMPGKPAWLQLEPGVAVRMQANTAACKVKYRLLEN